MFIKINKVIMFIDQEKEIMKFTDQVLKLKKLLANGVKKNL